jgi:hypothetical protein
MSDIQLFGKCMALTQKAEKDRADGGDAQGVVGFKHTNCFDVKGGKVLEYMSSYIVLVIGTKGFDGRMMIGLLHPQIVYFLLLNDVT